MSFLFNVLKGIALGAGAILPGISSGVLCVIFGIYEKILYSILNFFKDIKNNIKFLFPLFLGISIGIFLFSNFLKYFFTNFPIQINSIFIGLILGTFPSLIKSFKKDKNDNLNIKKCLFSFIVCLLIGIISIIVENSISISDIENISFTYLIFCGFLMSVGIVVPRCK